MDEVFSRRKVLTPEELRWLNARSDLAGWLQMSSHLGLIAVLAVAHGWAMGAGVLC